MTNPWLHDKVDRIIRDPVRKLGWNDRLFGTMQVALEQGIEPEGMALGAAAALSYVREQTKDTLPPRESMVRIWGTEAGGARQELCIQLVLEALEKLSDWTT
jgi:mannitol-1-phosphate 5-dehydrogenase